MNKKKKTRLTPKLPLTKLTIRQLGRVEGGADDGEDGDDGEGGDWRSGSPLRRCPYMGTDLCSNFCTQIC